MQFYIAMFRSSMGLFLVLLLNTAAPANSTSLNDHFLGADPQCVSNNEPVLLIADVTRSGEIDDTISMSVYRHLEQLGCIRVIGIVSIFGNGGESTSEVHNNLIARLNTLGISHWPILHGPNKHMPYTRHGKLSSEDIQNLSAIAAHIKAAKEPISIIELGPFTTSASLLRYKLIKTRAIKQIIGVGGRSPGEHFSTGKGLYGFAFRDMNVAEDRASVRYLLRHHASLLKVVTYKTGIGRRMITPGMVADITDEPAILRHAHKRAKTLKWIGYEGGIPSWDTWTMFPFIRGMAKRLGCKKTPGRMRLGTGGYRPTDMMQIQLLERPTPHTRQIIACHRVLE